MVSTNSQMNCTHKTCGLTNGLSGSKTHPKNKYIVKINNCQIKICQFGNMEKFSSKCVLYAAKSR